MSDKDKDHDRPRETGLEVNRRGLDPHTATGTRDRIDPETGVLATGGTPLTAGEGMSASTIGVGSNEGEQEYKDGDFAGETPGTHDYRTGVDGESSAHEE